MHSSIPLTVYHALPHRDVLVSNLKLGQKALAQEAEQIIQSLHGWWFDPQLLLSASQSLL